MRTKVFALAPWSSRRPIGSLDERAIFLCRYAVHIGVDAYSEAAFLVEEVATGSRKATLALLVADEFQNAALAIEQEPFARIWAGVAARMDRTEDKREAGLAMLDALFESRVGHGWPSRFEAAGIIDRSSFAVLVRRLSRRLSAREAAARKWADRAIVLAAERAGLMPEPEATNRTIWRANCPGTNHFLLIDPKAGTFGCGYCGVRGGPEALEALAIDRRYGDWGDE